MGPLRLDPIARGENFTEQVRETIVDAIAAGTLESGVLYSMQTLADQLGVSRTPVREAMLQLQQRGLVRMMRNQGAMIVDQSVEDLRQIFQLRGWLEVPATHAAVLRADAAEVQQVVDHAARIVDAAQAGDRLTFERADRAFHAQILRLSGNERLAGLVDDLRDFIMSRGHAASRHRRSLAAIIEQHEAIVQGFLDRDADAAASAMERHLELTASATIARAEEPLGD